MHYVYEKCNHYLDNSERLIKYISKHFDEIKASQNIHTTRYSHLCNFIGACYPSLTSATIHKMKSPPIKIKKPRISSWQEYDYDIHGDIKRLRTCEGENLFKERVYYFVKDGNAVYALPFKEDTNIFYPYSYWCAFVLENEKVKECMMMQKNEVHYQIYDYSDFDKQIVYCRYGTYDRTLLNKINQNYPPDKSGSPMKYDLGENKVTIYFENDKAVRMVDKTFRDGVERPHYEYINGKGVAAYKKDK